jgi:hypothetical protein
MWAEDPNHWNDTEQQLTFAEQAHLAFRHLLVDGDALALPWKRTRSVMARRNMRPRCRSSTLTV